MKSTQKNEMYMANAINLRHLTQERPTCWYFFALGNAKVLSFALGDTKLPNANGFASQWNIGFKRWHHVRHVDFMLFVWVFPASGSQHEQGSWWNIGYSVI